jgi:uncharacterized membrane protein YagU involved in acid resistance
MGLIRTAGRGAVAGFIATIPMTAVMVLGQRATSYGRLPPEAIVENALGETADPDLVADDAEADEDDLDDIEIDAAWRVTHLAVGAAFGAIYVLVFRPLTAALPPWLSGALFGLLEWRISYQNVAPAFDLLPPADLDDEDRQRTNVVAHLVYGASLGWIADRLR